MPHAWSGRRWRRRLARVCICLAVAAGVAAAARPSLAVPPTQREAILELVIDVSGTMQATDIAPTRLGTVQAATLQLLDKVPPRVRVGLVSFSDTGRSLVRPTTDRGAVLRQVAALTASGATATDDALRHALNDIGASEPRAPARILLISDGANTSGHDPVEVAPIAATRHVPVLTIALGTPGGTVEVFDEEEGRTVRVPVPPDQLHLGRIAAASGGRASAARSARELQSALDALLTPEIVGPERREVAPLFAAAALLLLAIGRWLRPSRPVSATAAEALPPATAPRRWTAAAVLVGVALAMGGSGLWLLVDAPAAAGDPAAIAAPPLPVAPPPPKPPKLSPQYVAISASKADRRLVEQAARLLRAHGVLAPQRAAEIRRKHLVPIAELEVSACDICRDEALTSTGSGTSTIDGKPVCDMTLNTRFVRAQAGRAGVPVRMVAAMAMLHEQERCLHRDGDGAIPFELERRLAGRLHDPRLFDLLYTQIIASGRDWRLVEQAVVTLREHGELAPQRGGDLRRRHLNQVGPLSISGCRGCLEDEDALGQSRMGTESGGSVACDIALDLTELESDARDWGLPAALVVASVLVHEQEHCVRDPDDRERPAVDEERRLAQKIGNARLLEYVSAFYDQLDASGYWKS